MTDSRRPAQGRRQRQARRRPRAADKSVLVEQHPLPKGHGKAACPRATTRCPPPSVDRRSDAGSTQGAGDDTPEDRPRRRRREAPAGLPACRRSSPPSTSRPTARLLAVAGLPRGAAAQGRRLRRWSPGSIGLQRARPVGRASRPTASGSRPRAARRAASARSRSGTSPSRSCGCRVPSPSTPSTASAGRPTAPKSPSAAPTTPSAPSTPTTGKQVLFQGAHSDWVLGTTFTQDGEHLVSISRDMSMKLTEVATQRFVDNVTSITPGALKGGLLALERRPVAKPTKVKGDRRGATRSTTRSSSAAPTAFRGSTRSTASAAGHRRRRQPGPRLRRAARPAIRPAVQQGRRPLRRRQQPRRQGRGPRLRDRQRQARLQAGRRRPGLRGGLPPRRQGRRRGRVRRQGPPARPRHRQGRQGVRPRPAAIAARSPRTSRERARPDEMTLRPAHPSETPSHELCNGTPSPLVRPGRPRLLGWPLARPPAPAETLPAGAKAREDRGPARPDRASAALRLRPARAHRPARGRRARRRDPHGHARAPADWSAVSPTGVVRPRGRRHGRLEVRLARAEPDHPGRGQGPEGRAAVSFVRDVMPLLSQHGLQRRHLPRVGGRQGRLQAVAARLRPAVRPPGPDRRPRRPGGSTGRPPTRA